MIFAALYLFPLVPVAVIAAIVLLLLIVPVFAMVALAVVTLIGIALLVALIAALATLPFLIARSARGRLPALGSALGRARPRRRRSPRGVAETLPGRAVYPEVVAHVRRPR
jgi:hypothetical protein